MDLILLALQRFKLSSLVQASKTFQQQVLSGKYVPDVHVWIQEQGLGASGTRSMMATRRSV